MDKIAIITGASRGLGKSMALHIARTGHDVLFTYHSNKAEADNVVAEIEALGRRAVALQFDVAAHGSFDAFAAKVRETLNAAWKRNDFNVLINNAGTGAYATVADTTEAQFDTMVDQHLKGPYFLTQKLLPLMKDGGRIINISSGLTRFSYAGYAAYAAMKGGVEVLTRYLATELGSRKITVNTIAPGAIETDFGGGAVRDNKELNALVASRTVLGRVGLPDDVGSAVASLLSDDAGWINAQRIEVSGGYST
jgi:NAD(P)-dependent dehydrogenase (short-subunit alcohol dehydrogenase family)